MGMTTRIVSAKLTAQDEENLTSVLSEYDTISETLRAGLCALRERKRARERTAQRKLRKLAAEAEQGCTEQ